MKREINLTEAAEEFLQKAPRSVLIVAVAEAAALRLAALVNERPEWADKPQAELEKALTHILGRMLEEAAVKVSATLTGKTPDEVRAAFMASKNPAEIHARLTAGNQSAHEIADAAIARAQLEARDKTKH